MDLPINQRTKTLLREYQDKDRAGGILDRRFGENDPTMTPEERMLERFTTERQRESKGVLFNLEDEDELTHYGQSLSRLDDFDNIGLGLDEDDEDVGQIDSRTVHKDHFGGFGGEEDDEGVSRIVLLSDVSLLNSYLCYQSEQKKTKAEVMAEVVAKSKEHKVGNSLNLSSIFLKSLSSSTSVRCNKKRTKTSDINSIKT